MRAAGALLIAMLLLGTSQCVCVREGSMVAVRRVGEKPARGVTAYQVLPDGGVVDLSDCFGDGGLKITAIWDDGGVEALQALPRPQQ